MIKYPDDFKAFHGKHLSQNEIHDLVQDTLELAKDSQPNEFSDFKASSHTGDIMVEVREFNYIIIWREIANHWDKEG